MALIFNSVWCTSFTLIKEICIFDIKRHHSTSHIRKVWAVGSTLRAPWLCMCSFMVLLHRIFTCGFCELSLPSHAPRARSKKEICAEGLNPWAVPRAI